MIFFGARTRITEENEKPDRIFKGCPRCGDDLVLSNVKRWFTLYFIPVFPFSDKGQVYHCDKCDVSYETSIKKKTMTKEENKKILDGTKKILVNAVGASVMLMAQSNKKDETKYKKELEYLKTKDFKDHRKYIEEGFEIGKKKDGKEKVLALIRLLKLAIPQEGVQLILTKTAKLHNITPNNKKQQELMKELLEAGGLSTSLYPRMMKELDKK